MWRPTSAYVSARSSRRGSSSPTPARRLFSERGFEEVSVAEIARAADVSLATVFNYFPTKEDLIYSGLEGLRGLMRSSLVGK